ncbi:GNAT family N-acetyltransferase [Vibrio zhugei]|uniref:GNAT family N-acetyltransferase n=1 Tax=Vibrio zhugei TaxID=2479546 RepID=A0ABV7CBW9_9VIBR|nr:GNAT family N-acetyltransferase [Vibrio zhugei]
MLRRFTAQDADHLITTIDSKQQCYLWSGPTYQYPLDHHQIEMHCAKREVYPYIFDYEGQAIGYVELYKVSPWHYRICRVLVFTPYRSQGWSKLMLQAAIDVAYHHHHAYKLSLAVFERNHIALHCYRDLGFRVSSVDRQSRTFEGEIWPLVRMKRSWWKRRLKKEP